MFLHSYFYLLFSIICQSVPPSPGSPYLPPCLLASSHARLSRPLSVYFSTIRSHPRWAQLERVSLSCCQRENHLIPEPFLPTHGSDRGLAASAASAIYVLTMVAPVFPGNFPLMIIVRGFRTGCTDWFITCKGINNIFYEFCKKTAVIVAE